MGPLKLRSGYMGAIYCPDQIIEMARFYLKGVPYDTMVGTGLSGALIVPTLARALDKYWLIVRKPDDHSHAGIPAEGTLGERWIFVDDFIQSGKTRRRVIETVKAIAQDYDRQIVHVGDYLYKYEEFLPRDPDERSPIEYSDQGPRFAW